MHSETSQKVGGGATATKLDHHDIRATAVLYRSRLLLLLLLLPVQYGYYYCCEGGSSLHCFPNVVVSIETTYLIITNHHQDKYCSNDRNSADVNAVR